MAMDSKLREHEEHEVALLQAAQLNGGATLSVWGPDQPAGGIVFAYAGPHHLGIHAEIQAMLRQHGVGFTARLEVEGEQK